MSSGIEHGTGLQPASPLVQVNVPRMVKIRPGQGRHQHQSSAISLRPPSLQARGDTVWAHEEEEEEEDEKPQDFPCVEPTPPRGQMSIHQLESHPSLRLYSPKKKEPSIPSTAPIEAYEPSAPKTSPGVPEVIIRPGATPILRVHGATPEVLKEICLTGVVGEEVQAEIMVMSGEVSSSRSPGDYHGSSDAPPLGVKVSVHYPNSGPATFDVSPGYLYLERPCTLTVRFTGRRAGEHSGFLLLEYMGCQAHIWLRGKAEEQLSFDATGGLGATSSSTTCGGPGLPPSTLSPLAEPSSSSLLSWGVLCVGCSAVREISLRNHQPVAVFVRCSVEGDGSAAFNVDGGGRIGPGGNLRLVLTFEPNQPGHWISFLNIWATPDNDRGMAPASAVDTGRQGALEYLTPTAGKERGC